MKTKRVSDEALQPLIDFVNSEPGRKAELTRRMADELGSPVHRQLVEGWVHPTPDKRVEPRMGLGIILLRVGGIMMGSRRPLNLGVAIKHARKNNGAANGEVKAKRPRKSKVATPEPGTGETPGFLEDIHTKAKSKPKAKRRRSKD